MGLHRRQSDLQAGSDVLVGQTGPQEPEDRQLPQSVRASPGLLSIVVRNDGRLTHNLTVSRGGTAVAQTAAVSPGASVELVITVTRGQYQIASTLLSDQTLGMYGTLTVG